MVQMGVTLSLSGDYVVFILAPKMIPLQFCTDKGALDFAMDLQTSFLHSAYNDYSLLAGAHAATLSWLQNSLICVGNPVRNMVQGWKAALCCSIHAR
jgi:hypothetical protein